MNDGRVDKCFQFLEVSAHDMIRKREFPPHVMDDTDSAGKIPCCKLVIIAKCFLEDDFAWRKSKIDGCKTAWRCSPRDDSCVCRQIHMVLRSQLESVMKSKVFF